MIINPVKTRIFQENESITHFIDEHIETFSDGDILVITSKILALSEWMLRSYQDENDFQNLVKEESEFSLKTKWVYLTLKDGIIMANAWIDSSNVGEGKCILLPKKSFDSAQVIWNNYRERYSLKNLGILITDSHCTPLRQWITWIALGYAGFLWVKDYRWQKDLFWKEFHYSTVHIADCLASSAVLVMWEGQELSPLCIIKWAPVTWNENPTNSKEGIIEPEDDMYRDIINFSSLR
jgi:dihydrofolate synthase / folylpolyglutamate synthase